MGMLERIPAVTGWGLGDTPWTCHQYKVVKRMDMNKITKWKFDFFFLIESSLNLSLMSV